MFPSFAELSSFFSRKNQKALFAFDVSPNTAKRIPVDLQANGERDKSQKKDQDGRPGDDGPGRPQPHLGLKYLLMSKATATQDHGESSPKPPAPPQPSKGE